jgi:hypothetical protein
MAQWDPIGVGDSPDAADEYDLYIGGVYELLETGAPSAALSNYLRTIEVDRMELIDASGQPLLPESTRNAASFSLKELSRYFSEA